MYRYIDLLCYSPSRLCHVINCTTIEHIMYIIKQFVSVFVCLYVCLFPNNSVSGANMGVNLRSLGGRRFTKELMWMFDVYYVTRNNSSS